MWLCVFLEMALKASDMLSKGSDIELYAQAEYSIINTLPRLPVCYWGLDLESQACQARYVLEQSISFLIPACLGGSMEKVSLGRLGPYCFFFFFLPSTGS